ncbi:hypothetical protein [Nocardia sp. NRRL S-836]|uniref:hypothetical protein n=1 Tax=Nocardia sp. NRRL S-836 TaxID=1519492 RepID=UPI0006AF4CA5|nr:hypothetical protein [Nocardia sp. NRRL S-836]KOV84794.1 hypothetical protein ADL03_16145 [Nocardia sp. NRRL S-836]
MTPNRHLMGAAAHGITRPENPTRGSTMQEQHEQQAQQGTADKTPHRPFHVEWVTPLRYRAKIDPSRPRFAGLTPADFPAFDSTRLSDAADAALEFLETEDNVISVDERDVRYVTVSPDTDPGEEG